MGGAGKAAHIAPNLGDDHVRRDRAYSWNRDQPFDRGAKGLKRSLDLRLELRDRGLQLLQGFKMLAEQEPVMSGDSALQCLSQGGARGCQPLAAQLGNRLGSATPATRAF